MHKMTASSGDGSESTAKQELIRTSHGKPASSSFLRVKDPRIVRVSSAFGGKDRHSKVQTLKGLRDRRVRLSVSTAIQLYDLQDRLGLNQPSKVFDWLLHAAKDEIDELPPLPMLPEHFIHNHQGIKTGTDTSCQDPIQGVPTYGDFGMLLGANRAKELVEREVADSTKENWMRRTDDEEHDRKLAEGEGAHGSSSFSYPRGVNYFPFPGTLNYTNATQCESYHRWDTSNLSLSNLGSHGLTTQTADLPNFNALSFATASTGSMESNGPRHFQMLTSDSVQNPGAPPHPYLSQSVGRSPFQLSMNPPN